MTDVLGMPLGFAAPPRRRSRTVMAVVFLVLVVTPVVLFPIVVAMADHPTMPSAPSGPVVAHQPQHA
ncbi:hypothetical protein acdb102_13150 [Acidothermaceae bacterium B102]|nr:hypothetical protein acdb102_13150 [Acidothermaceae bacterium B102]